MIGALGLVAVVALVRLGPVTDIGRRLIEAELQGLSIGRYGRLRIEGLGGDVWRDFSVRRLTISDSRGVWVEANNVRVRWQSGRLLQRWLWADEIDAARLAVLRKPVLAPAGRGGRAALSLRLGKLSARLELAPAFAGRSGSYGVVAAADLMRSGGSAGKISIASLTHPGDRLDADFDLGRNKSLKLDLAGVEAHGGALAGALGLAPDQPFFIVAKASGRISQGRFSIDSRSGALKPVEASGAWAPSGGGASGHITLAASRLLSGYQKMLGPDLAFAVSGRRSQTGFTALQLAAHSENVDLAANGEADIGRRVTGPHGLSVRLLARSAQRVIFWPETGPGRFAGAFATRPGGWDLTGSVSIEAAHVFDYTLDRVAGPASLRWRGGEVVLATAFSGEGGKGRDLVTTLLGARPHGALELAWLRDGRFLMRSIQVFGPGLTVNGTGQRTLFGGLSFKGQASFNHASAASLGSKGLFTAGWTAAQAGRGPWSVSIDGGAKGFASGAADLDRLLGQSPRLIAKGTLDGHGLEIADARLQGLAGSAQAAGLIGGDGGLQLKIVWSAKGPMELGPLELAGSAQGSGALTGSIASPKADLAADLAQVSLPGLTLSQAHVALSFLKGPQDTDGGFSIAGASPYGPAKANTQFRLVQAGFDLTNLNADAGGAHAEGEVSLRQGAPSSANLNVSVGPGAFLTRGKAMGRLQIVEAAGGPRASVKVSATGAMTRTGAFIVQSGTFTAEGPLAKLPYSVTANGYTPHGSWRTTGGGALVIANGDYSATFEGQGRLRNADFRTLAPAEVHFGRTEKSARVLAEIGGGRAQAQVRRAGGAIEAQADFSNVSLGLLDQDFTGRFDAQMNLAGQGAKLGGRVQAKLADAGERGAKGAPTLDGTVAAVLADQAVTLDAQVGNGADMTSQAHFVLPVEASAAPLRVALARTSPMSGQFQAHGEIKTLWDLLLGGERSLSGQVQAEGTVAGTPAAPRFQAVAQVGNGQFNDEDTGLVLKNVTLNARLADDVVDISQFAGQDPAGGTATGVGQISLRRGGASNFRLDVKRFRLIDTNELTALASGEASINLAADGKVKLTGALTIDRADVSPNAPALSGVTPLDVVEINREPGSGGHLEAEASRAPAVALDVTLKAGRGVFLKGRGLNLEASLDAHVTGTTAAPEIGGVVRVVRGDYDFAGKRFEFDNRGVVYLASTPEKIRLDLTATRDDPSLTAVIHIAGTAAKPTITLSSSPVLPNDEVLSQVLFGSSAAQLSAAQAAELASAVVALRGGGALDVLGNLRTFAHLDRLALGGDQSSGVTVSGGKYLTDNVYMELTGGGRSGPSGQVEWRVRKSLSIVSKIAGSGGDSQISVRWRKDY
jgi:translocation and assembly module TamB